MYILLLFYSMAIGWGLTWTTPIGGFQTVSHLWTNNRREVQWRTAISSWRNRASMLQEKWGLCLILETVMYYCTDNLLNTIWETRKAEKRIVATWRRINVISPLYMNSNNTIWVGKTHQSVGGRGEGLRLDQRGNVATISFTKLLAAREKVNSILSNIHYTCNLLCASH